MSGLRGQAPGSRSPRLARLAIAALVGLGLAQGPVTIQLSPAAAQPPRPAQIPPRPPVLPDVSAQPTPATPAPDPIDDLEHLTPPDGKWLQEADGREYFVTRFPKVEGTYYIPTADSEWVYYKRLYRWPLVKHDQTHVYVKMYRVPEDAPGAVDAAPRPSTVPEERGFEFEDRRVDRLVFTAFDADLPREGQWRQGFDVADMNGDGHLDIVHGPPRKAIFEPVIFLGDGAGKWRVWEEASWPELAYDYGDAAAGDVNGDGLMDLALGVHLRGVLVLLQEERGRFVDGSKGLIFDVPGGGSDASGFASRAVDFVDWNGDGRLDLLALGEGARQSSTLPGSSEGLPLTRSYGVLVFINGGDGTWHPRGGGYDRGVFGDSFALGDFNLDGRVDVASSSHAMGIRRILMVNSDASDGWEAVEIGSLRRRSWTYAVASGDFDRDGRVDLVSSFGAHSGTEGRSGIELSRVDAKGTWKTELILADSDVEAAWALAAGDVDGDGNLDVVATTNQGKVWVLLGDGKGGFAREDSPELDGPTESPEVAAPPYCRGYEVNLADLDGDGRAEILASFAAETGEMERLLGRPECVGQGSLRVWRPQLRDPNRANPS